MIKLGSRGLVRFLSLAIALLTAIAVAESVQQGEKAPDISLSETIWDFGIIPRGDEAVHTFEVRNIGSAELRIDQVRSSCSCLKVEVPLDRLAPDQSMEIKAIFMEDNRLGRTTKTIYIDSNDPDEPRKMLRVTGIVEGEPPEIKTKVPALPQETQLPPVPTDIYGSMDESYTEQPLVSISIFVSNDCDDCAAVRNELVPHLSEKLKGMLKVKYYSIDEPENYDLLVNLEEQFQDLGNAIPVAFIGEHVLGDQREITENLERLTEYYLSRGGCDFPSVLSEKKPKGTSRDKVIYLAYFYTAGCRECDRVHYMLNSFEHSTPGLKVKRFNSELKENMKLNEAMCNLFGVPEERRLIVPSIFVGEVHLVKGEITDSNVRSLIEKYREQGTRCPWKDAHAMLAKAERGIIERFRSFGPLAVVTAGLIDGVNPCAFATIIFLISYLSLIGRKGKELMYVGLAFTAAVFTTYFLVGLGIFQFIHSLGIFSMLSRIIYLLTAVLAFILGVLSFYDFLKFKQGKEREVKLQLPKFLKDRIHMTIRKSTRSGRLVPAAFAAGAIVSFLELECTGQVYLPTISFVVGMPSLRAHAIFYLLVYNLMFILPLIVIFGLTYFGATWEQFAAVMRKYVAEIKIITALFFFGLCGLLLAAFF
jgi:uncharacterized membrane protein YuzA (DUF378 family)